MTPDDIRKWADRTRIDARHSSDEDFIRNLDEADALDAFANVVEAGNRMPHGSHCRCEVCEALDRVDQLKL